MIYGLRSKKPRLVMEIPTAPPRTADTGRLDGGQEARRYPDPARRQDEHFGTSKRIVDVARVRATSSAVPLNLADLLLKGARTSQPTRFSTTGPAPPRFPGLGLWMVTFQSTPRGLPGGAQSRHPALADRLEQISCIRSGRADESDGSDARAACRRPGRGDPPRAQERIAPADAPGTGHVWLRRDVARPGIRPEPQRKGPSLAAKPLSMLAGGLGFEPRLTESESVVLSEGEKFGGDPRWWHRSGSPGNVSMSTLQRNERSGRMFSVLGQPRFPHSPQKSALSALTVPARRAAHCAHG